RDIKVVADSGLGITAPRVLNQDKGVIASRDGLRLSGTELFNGNAGLLSSQRHIEVTLDGVLDNQGKGALLSDGTLTVSAGRIHNQDATMSRAGALRLSSQEAMDNRGGKLVTDSSLRLTSASLNNSRSGIISANAAAENHTG
ncbi:hypothetical protein, partial [Pseudomonas aeruginosa]